MAMSITADSLLLRSKLDCDVGYDAAVKGVSVVVTPPPHVSPQTDPSAGGQDSMVPESIAATAPGSSMAGAPVT